MPTDKDTELIHGLTRYQHLHISYNGDKFNYHSIFTVADNQPFRAKKWHEQTKPWGKSIYYLWPSRTPSPMDFSSKQLQYPLHSCVQPYFLTAYRSVLVAWGLGGGGGQKIASQPKCGKTDPRVLWDAIRVCTVRADDAEPSVERQALKLLTQLVLVVAAAGGES